MSDQARRKKLPSHQPLNEFFHSPDRCDPGAINRLLVMHQVGRRLELNCAAFAEKNNSPPAPSGTDRRCSRIRMAGTFNSTLDSAPRG